MALFLGGADLLGGLLGGGDILAGLFGAGEAVAPEIAAADAAPLFAGSAADFLGASAADVAAGAGAGGAFGLTDAGLAGLGAEGAATLGGAGAAAAGADALSGFAPDALSQAGISDALAQGMETADAGNLAGLTQVASLGNNALGTATDSGLLPSALGGPGGGAPVLAGGGPAVVPATAELPGSFGTGELGDLSQISAGVGGDVPPTAGASAGGMLTPANQALANASSVSPGAFAAAPAATAPAAGAAASGGAAAGGGGLFGTGISGNTALLAGAGLTPLAIAMMRGEQPLPQQANQLQGLASQQQQFATQQEQQYQANQVNPAQQASLDNARAQLTNQWRQALFNQGVQNPESDTRWPQIEATIESQVQQMKVGMLSSNLQGAFSASGQAGQDLANLANMQVQQDQAYQQAINQATQAAGMVVGLGAASGKLFG